MYPDILKGSRGVMVSGVQWSGGGGAWAQPFTLGCSVLTNIASINNTINLSCGHVYRIFFLNNKKKSQNLTLPTVLRFALKATQINITRS